MCSYCSSLQWLYHDLIVHMLPWRSVNVDDNAFLNVSGLFLYNKKVFKILSTSYLVKVMCSNHWKLSKGFYVEVTETKRLNCLSACHQFQFCNFLVCFLMCGHCAVKKWVMDQLFYDYTWVLDHCPLKKVHYVDYNAVLYICWSIASAVCKIKYETLGWVLYFHIAWASRCFKWFMELFCLSLQPYSKTCD